MIYPRLALPDREPMGGMPQSGGGYAPLTGQSFPAANASNVYAATS